MVFMPHWPKTLGQKPINFGLERILELLEKLGSPHKKLPPVIHVAGTNGKGSTVAFTRAILEAAGYKVHVYTSPHLINFNERIVIAGHEISDDYLYELAEECRIAAEGMQVTFFEGTTAMAFLAFAKNKADFVLLETGMGGRLDATNVVDNPALTIITPISLDHMEYLGPTLSTICREKAAIMKKDTPCIASIQEEEVDLILQQHAEITDCPIFSYGYDWIVEKTDNGFSYKSQNLELSLPRPSLLGDHQIINAGTAIAGIEQLKDRFNITEDNIQTGITNASWPARMQQITKGKLINLLPDGSEVWIDGAHNMAGGYVAANLMADMQDDKPLFIICGFTKNRDPKSILQFFKGHARFIAGVLVETEPSATHGDKIATEARSIGFASDGFDSIEDALSSFKTIENRSLRVLFCGSLYLASDALKLNN